MATRGLLPIRGTAALLALAVGIALGEPSRARADLITDPKGDFIPSYIGPKTGNLDVLAANVTFAGSHFFFYAKLAGPVADPTVVNQYVFGIDRGKGTPGFASLGLDGVLFDSVVVLRSDGTSNVPGTTVTVVGDEIFGTVPASATQLLPNGVPREQFAFNLWPRTGTLTGNPSISDFAPDNATARVTSPEPPTYLLLGAALLGVAVFVRRKRAAVAASAG